jgi:flagellar hook-length control protein FliK
VSCAPPGLAEQLALASGALQEPDETDTAAQDIPGREASNDLRPSTSRHRGPAAEPAGWRSAASGLAAPSDAPQRSLEAIKTPGWGTEHSALLALQERSNDRIPESLQPASTAFAGTLKSLIAAGEAPSTSAPTPNIPVTVAVSDPRFGHALGDRISWMVKEGLQTAELTLNPPELGPIRVALSLEGDSAHFGFQATHVETRAAIEQALPRLRELLSEQGLKLGDAAVGSHADQQARSGEHRGPGASRSGRPGTGLDDADPRQDEPARSQPMRHRGIGRIDLFV